MMTYAEVLTCGKSAVAETYSRASKLLADMTDAAKCRREFLPGLSHEQMSWNIYRLYRGLDFCRTAETMSGAELGVRVDFNSLEELNLILAARGY